jgi:hypothetical protein
MRTDGLLDVIEPMSGWVSPRFELMISPTQPAQIEIGCRWNHCHLYLL